MDKHHWGSDTCSRSNKYFKKTWAVPENPRDNEQICGMKGNQSLIVAKVQLHTWNKGLINESLIVKVMGKEFKVNIIEEVGGIIEVEWEDEDNESDNENMSMEMSKKEEKDDMMLSENDDESSEDESQLDEEEGGGGFEHEF
ncbi:hypothetical protein Tco_1092801 [Tanacetum coccineum]|uniref:Uncharacterized protein n=1 Tax=Tanacetum coccineum TaxID=301880 RepID=A0ABQ5ID13_9ASTR